MEALQLIANYFATLGQHSFAKEAYLKLGDIRALLNLHIKLGKWDDAMRLVKSNPDMAPNFYLSYAEWLASNDRFEEAREAFIKAERPDVALKLMERLTKNTIVENRFGDTSYYFWQLALENLRLIEDCNNPNTKDAEYYGKFEEYRNLSEIYYAYNNIYKHLEEPFHSVIPGTNHNELIFNACRFLLNSMGFASPLGVSKLNVYYALSKTAKNIEAYKTSR
jgi:intraflagellar transport protein 122